MKLSPTISHFAILISILVIVQSLTGQTVLENWQIHQKMEEQSAYGGILWQRLGPEFMGSRVETLEVPFNNPSIMYVGFGSGGLWKTENMGLTWKNIFANQPSFSMGDLAISNQNSDVLWLGTGEQIRASQGYSFPGTGVYRSLDGGNTWEHKGLSDTHHIGRIIIDPYDSNTVFVAAFGHFWSKNTQRGLFMTQDGGENWENILYISDSVGVNDIIWDANNKIIYAASWQIPDGQYSRIYRSYDMGRNWDILKLPLNGGEKIGRIGLGHSASNPENVYALVDNRNPSHDNPNEQIGSEVFKSGDFGDTWKQTNSEKLINGGGFGWAFGDIVPHPVKSEEIFILGVHLMKSLDGGKTFQRIGGDIFHINPSIATSLHLDQHDFKIIPGEIDTWILGNDGGIYISTDEGKSWIHTNTIPTGEFHDVYPEGRNPVWIYGGTQDNSNLYGTINPYNYSNPQASWNYVWLDPWSGGDGFSCMPSQQDRNLIFWESQNGYINKKNIITQENKLIKPKPDADESPLRNSWFTPFFTSVHNNQTLYYGANKIYKSIDLGESWFRVSHDLSFSENPDKKSRSICCLAESPVRAGVLYAGTEKGSVWVSRNDGSKWFEVSDGIPIKKVTGIFPSNHNPSRVYLVLKGMDDDDQQAYVYVSDNYGSKWQNISNNLPFVPVNCIIEDPLMENLLYVGTDAGVLLSKDNGKNWDAISLTMPTATIQQLRWMSDNNFLLAASHGQGLFYCDARLLRKFARSGYQEDAQYLGSIDGVLPRDKDYNNDWDFETLQPVVLSWYSPGKLETLVDIYDSNGELIYSHQIISQKGINQFIWDLIIETEADNTNYPLPKIKFLKTGKYDVQILVDAKSLNGDFEVINQN